MAEVSEKLEQHPIAKLFPVPSREEIDAIKQNVFKSNGVSSKDPVVTFDGKVIEKWHEYSACMEFSLPCAITGFKGTLEDMINYLLQKNTFQLSKEQRAFIAVYLKKIYRSTARENQSAGGAGKTSIDKYHSREAAAKMMRISPRMVSNAESIIDSGCDELIDFVTEGLLSISRAADIARLKPKKQTEFLGAFNVKMEKVFNVINPYLIDQEEKAAEKHEEEKRYIKKVYKDKRQVENIDIQKRISLADTPEEEEQLKQERAQARKDLKDYQKTQLEKAKLNYEEKRAGIVNKWHESLLKMKKYYIKELTFDALDKEKKYVVYLQWDYELGEIELRAVYDKLVSWDRKTDIVTLKSGRKIYDGPEGIASTHTADMAKEICDKINGKKFCRNHRIFKPNSIQQRVYNKIGKDFLEKAQELIL